MNIRAWIGRVLLGCIEVHARQRRLAIVEAINPDDMTDGELSEFLHGRTSQWKPQGKPATERDVWMLAAALRGFLMSRADECGIVTTSTIWRDGEPPIVRLTTERPLSAAHRLRMRAMAADRARLDFVVRAA